MKGSEYIRRVFHEVTRTDGAMGNCSNGVFLAAALEIMKEVESPLKEEALVRLAIIESDGSATHARSRLRA